MLQNVAQISEIIKFIVIMSAVFYGLQPKPVLNSVRHFAGRRSLTAVVSGNVIKS